MKSQSRRIIESLIDGNEITALEAVTEFYPPITRLAARISNLRDKGVKISDKWVHPPNGKKAYKKYFLDKSVIELIKTEEEHDKQD